MRNFLFKTVRGRVGRFVLLTGFLLAGSRLRAEEAIDFSAFSASGLLGAATQQLSNDEYDAAIPYLTEYMNRMTDSDDPRVKALIQEVRLKLAKISIYLEDPEAAIQYLRDYTQTLPLYKPREALKILAVTLYNEGDYEGCIAAATNALTEPPPQGLPEEKKQVNVEELTADERGGYSVRQLKRIESEYGDDEPEADLSQGFSGEMSDPEPPYTEEERVLIHMTLAEAYSAVDDLQASLPHYQYVMDHAVAEDRRGYAIMQMVDALIRLERANEAERLIIQLSKTDARYDIRVNMAMMSAASALFNQGEYDSALILYRMVLPRGLLIAHQEQKMNDRCRSLNLPEIKVTIVTNQTGRVETMFGRKYAEFSQVSTPQAAAAGQPAMPMDLIEMQEAIATVVALPPYEQDLLFRMGQLYGEEGRPWEAVAAYNGVTRQHPDGDLGLRAFFEMLMVLTDPLKEYERVETTGKRFLETHQDGLAPRQVAYALVAAYQKQERWDAIKQLLPVIRGFVFSDDETVRQYEGELYYMQGIADLMLLNYEAAKDGFEYVLTSYPGSRQQENATYWRAMSLLFLQQYASALEALDDYLEKYPRGDWLAEATFRSAICLFGLEDYEQAKTRFTRVIDSWPDASVYPDACSLRGDLLASEGLLTEAQRDYEEAIATARTARQATYAVFQMTSMFELEKRYDEILAAVDDYLASFGDEADVAKAAYWIGKIKLAQGRVDEAVQAYQEAIVRYGGDVEQDGVDQILSELVVMAKRKLTDEQRNALEQSLGRSLKETDSLTLQLRLRVLLAQIDGTEEDLGRTLLAEVNDLTQAPPPVLGLICDASFEKKDYSRAKDLLRMFQSRYENSEFMRAAFKLRAVELYSTRQYDEALKLIDETQALYGIAPDVAWAQLMKGHILLEQGKFDAARKVFSDVFNVPGWRGDPQAEAAYMLGQTAERSGDLRTAHNWYQRAYFQYKGYADGHWAAEAYLASARCLETLGYSKEALNTYRAMLFDKYVNQLPQAEQARAALGSDVAGEIAQMLIDGIETNLTVTISAEGTDK